LRSFQIKQPQLQERGGGEGGIRLVLLRADAGEKLSHLEFSPTPTVCGTVIPHSIKNHTDGMRSIVPLFQLEAAQDYKGTAARPLIEVPGASVFCLTSQAHVSLITRIFKGMALSVVPSE